LREASGITELHDDEPKTKPPRKQPPRRQPRRRICGDPQPALGPRCRAATPTLRSGAHLHRARDDRGDRSDPCAGHRAARYPREAGVLALRR
jgi:hypothetical protein